MTSLFKPPLPVLIGSFGGNNGGGGSSISNGGSSVVVSTDTSAGVGSVQIITNGTPAVNVDNSQYVIIGNKSGITPSRRLTVVDPTGQCIQLINSGTQSSVNFKADNALGLTISTSGSKINMESNSVYLSADSLHIGATLVSATATQLNYNMVTPGKASATKSLVLDADRNINNINSLSATNLSGTLLSSYQPNISHLDTVNISSLSLGGVKLISTAAELNHLQGATLGVALANKAIVLDSGRNIQGLNTISASAFSGTIATPSQPNITSIGTLNDLTVNNFVSIGNPSPTRSLDILATNPVIRLSNGSYGVELSVDMNGSYRISPDRDVIIGSHKNLLFSGTSSILGLNTLNATNVIGTIQTSSQPNITSIGALSSLSVLGDVLIGSTDSSSTSTRLIINEPNGKCITIARSVAIRCDINLSSVGDLELNLYRDIKILNGSGLRMAGPIVGVTDLSAATIGGTLQTADQPNITSVGTLSSLSVLNGITATNIAADTLAGTLQTASQPNITSVGTLSSLAITNGLTAGSITSSTLTGTLETAAQPKITSLGSLTSLTVVNGINADTITATSLAGTLSTSVQPNITSVGVLSSLEVANSLTSGSVTAQTLNGVITTASQPNITSIGTLSSLDVVNSITSSSVSANTLSGTLTTGLQPNITSVGTLSSLRVVESISALSVSATTLTGTLDTGFQPNISSVGTLDKLKISGTLGIGVPNATSVIDINTSNMMSISASINITDGTNTGSISVTPGGLVLDTNTSFLTLGPGVNLRFNGGSITGLSDITATSFTGTLQTASQPNITSLGTLDHLNAGHIGIGTNSSEYLINMIDPNGKMITMSNGALSLIASVVGSDFTIHTSNRRLALGSNVSLVLNGGTIIGLDDLVANTLTGTIQTSAQPNITSLGTLSSLSVAGGVVASDATLGHATISGDLTVNGSLNLSTPLSFSNVSSETAVFNSNVEATSSTSGGTLTVIGGAAFSRNVYIGTSLTIGSATITEATLNPISGLTPGIVTPNVLISSDGANNLEGFNNLSAMSFIGTIQTGYQPNITTIGNLDNLNVNGYLGIGNTSPNRQLEINSTNGNCLRLSYDKASNATPAYLDVTVDALGCAKLFSTGNRLTICPTMTSKQILLGNTTNSVMPLEIGFSPFAMTERYAFNSSANARGIITPVEPFPVYNYSIRALGRILCTQSLDVMSDRRTKKNICELTDEFCTSFIESTTPVSFYWKEGDAHKSFGYIAQDIIRAGFPDLVNLAKDDTIKEEIDDDGFINPEGVKFTVSYQHVIPILAKNQQRLMKENAELNAKLNAILEMLQSQRGSN